MKCINDYRYIVTLFMASLAILLSSKEVNSQHKENNTHNDDVLGFILGGDRYKLPISSLHTPIMLPILAEMGEIEPGKYYEVPWIAIKFKYKKFTYRHRHRNRRYTTVILENSKQTKDKFILYIRKKYSHVVPINKPHPNNITEIYMDKKYSIDEFNYGTMLVGEIDGRVSLMQCKILISRKYCDVRSYLYSSDGKNIYINYDINYEHIGIWSDLDRSITDYVLSSKVPG